MNEYHIFELRRKISTAMINHKFISFSAVQTYDISCINLQEAFYFIFFLRRKGCETLLKFGAEVDSKDNNSRTALMWSVQKNNLECARLLLDYKASVDLQDTDGDCALHAACGQGHVAMVRLLLDSGASLMLCNKRGNGCLEIAAKAGSSDVALAIVKHKR